MGKTETDIVRRLILEPMRKRYPGSQWTKVPGSQFNVGLPDVIGTVEGRAIWLEAKKESNRKGQPTPIQADNLFAAAKAGGYALVAIFGKRGAKWVQVGLRQYFRDGKVRDVGLASGPEFKTFYLE